MVKAGTVLLIDDEEVILRIQAAAVRQFGFRVLTANTAEEALKIATETQLELILSDVHMPGEGGFEFVPLLLERGLKKMPVVFLTAYDDMRLVSGGLKAGGDDFIIKGRPIEELKARVAFWMISGFTGLPDDLRRRALALGQQGTKGQKLGVESALKIDPLKVQKIIASLSQELTILCGNYGSRLIERVFVLGRACKLVIDASNRVEDFIRFPDYLRQVIQGLNKPWSDDFSSLFAEFDRWSSDHRFLQAAPIPLREVTDYPSISGQ